MITAAVLAAKVVGDTKDGEDALDRVNAKVEQSGGFFKTLAGNALSFATGGAILTAGATAAGFLVGQLKDSVTAATDAQQVQAQLAQGIKSTGDASGMTVEQLENLAESNAKLTTFSKTAVEQSQAVTLTFTNIGSKVFPAATVAAEDLATRMKEDLGSATLQLDKALGNPIQGITALTRVGVVFTEQQKQQIKTMADSGNMVGAQAIILGELQKEFGGSAEAAGKTFGGALQIMNNQLDMAREKVGNALMPILAKLMTAVTPLVTAFGDWLPGALAAVTGFISGDVSPVLDKLSSWFQGDGVNGIEGVVKSVAADLLPGLQKFAGYVVSNGMPILHTLSDIFVNDILPVVENVASAVFNQLLPPLESILGRVLPVLNPALQLLGWILGNVVGPALGLVVNILAGVLTAIDNVLDAIGNLLGALGHVKDAIGGALGGVGGALHTLHVPGFAGGGTLPEGLAVVGERGPEVISAPGARVTPISSGGLPGMATAGGGGGQLVQVTTQINLDGYKVAQVVTRHQPAVIRNITGERGM